MAPDLEAKSYTFLTAFSCVIDLIHNSDPRMTISPEPMSALLRLLLAEAHQVVPSHAPTHRMGRNDNDG